jgi:DNA-binding NtrC family response regulator
MSARILIIDDEPRWIDFASGDLGLTFEVEVATNLKEALAKLRENRYILIIASSRHLDVLEAIREQYPDKRFVVATGQPTSQEAITIYRLGAVDYFAKDFRPTVVSKKVHEVIQ